MRGKELVKADSLTFQRQKRKIGECLSTSHYKATQVLLMTNLVILNHGQRTRMSPELAIPLQTTTSRKLKDFEQWSKDKFSAFLQNQSFGPKPDLTKDCKTIRISRQSGFGVR
ncbi:uncharacterized protein TNCV_4843911 [Trichonephila clavipes]|uniref:Uncharacterized protein n=1 Tax=Trichonephila clavipes TaxID=2585209 RepID=A0A8X7BMW6_TRICX|nr:uncharacterized protein TNCV_4843911 [Trichonephila clavipes]